jgi:hypothetical protein
LTTKVSSPGKTANEAVHHFVPSAVQESVANSSDEDSDSEMQDQDADDEELVQTTNTQTVLELFNKVNAWRRFEGPQS